jgi:hypothetical protein
VENRQKNENIISNNRNFRRRTNKSIGEDLPTFIQFLESHNIFVDPENVDVILCKACCSSWYRYKKKMAAGKSNLGNIRSQKPSAHTAVIDLVEVEDGHDEKKDEFTEAMMEKDLIEEVAEVENVAESKEKSEELKGRST